MRLSVLPDGKDDALTRGRRLAVQCRASPSPADVVRDGLAARFKPVPAIVEVRLIE
jgi:hypothetical protein